MAVSQQFWASRHPYKPITASEMAERFKYEFHVGIAISEELSVPVSEDEQLANVSLFLLLALHNFANISEGRGVLTLLGNCLHFNAHSRSRHEYSIIEALWRS